MLKISQRFRQIPMQKEFLSMQKVVCKIENQKRHQDVVHVEELGRSDKEDVEERVKEVDNWYPRYYIITDFIVTFFS